MADPRMLTRCTATTEVQIGNQVLQTPRCERRNEHEGPHAAGVLDSDDNPITHRWSDRG
jgi:hypothetical protein